MLAAMAGPAEERDLGLFSDPLPFNPQAGGQQGFINYQSAARVNWELGSMIGQAPVMPHMKMGDVTNIKGLKLSVGTGPDNSSVLSSKDHDVAVESQTVLLLIPAEGAIPRAPEAAAAASASPSAVSAAPATVAEPPIEDIDRCVPPECSEALPPGNASDLGKAATSISISQLGYAPRRSGP